MTTMTGKTFAHVRSVCRDVITGCIEMWCSELGIGSILLQLHAWPLVILNQAAEPRAVIFVVGMAASSKHMGL